MASSYNELYGLGASSEPAELVLLMPMQDDAASTAVDDVSSDNNNGTLVGGDNTSGISTTGPTSWLTKGLALDGTNDYITLGNVLGFSKTDAFSITMWVRPDAALSTFVVFAGKQTSTPVGWAIRNGGVSDRQRLVFQLQGTVGQIFNQTDDLIFSSSTWYHIAATYSGSGAASGVKIYVNSVEKTTVGGRIDNLTGTITNSDAASVGARASTGAGKFDGIVGQVTIHARALTAAEIAQDYAGPEPINLSVPTLSINSSAWTGTVGSWDSQGNGSITYAWELRDADDDSVVESGTGSSPSGSGSYSGNYYLWVRATNSGGFSAADDAASATQSAGDGEITGSAAATASLSGSLTGTGSLAGSTSGVAALAGTIVASGSLAGSLAGTASLSATLTATGSLAGTTNGAATLAGELTEVGSNALAGGISASGSLAGTLTGTGAVAGTSSASATASATIGGTAAASGQIAATAAVAGTLDELLGAIFGSVDATATLTGVMIASGSLAGAVSASASVSGSLTTPGVVAQYLAFDFGDDQLMVLGV